MLKQNFVDVEEFLYYHCSSNVVLEWQNTHCLYFEWLNLVPSPFHSWFSKSFPCCNVSIWKRNNHLIMYVYIYIYITLCVWFYASYILIQNILEGYDEVWLAVIGGLSPWLIVNLGRLHMDNWLWYSCMQQLKKLLSHVYI